jgi:hypothetical protein
MFKTRQYVALARKSRFQITPRLIQHRQLQRNLALKGAVGAPGKPNFGHSPRPERSNQFVRAHSGPGLQPALTRHARKIGESRHGLR